MEVGPGEWSLEDLPYGVFSTGGNRHLGVAIGQSVFDIHRAANVGLFRDVVAHDVLLQGSLNPVLELGPNEWSDIRGRIRYLLTEPDQQARVEPLFVPLAEIELHLPWEVADFVDFYSSRHHAENVGRLFRPDDEPLLPNWLRIPVGYHGRAGTVLVTGSDIHRPSGVIDGPGGPQFGPTHRLDFEVELGFVLGNPTAPGLAVPARAAENHVFGVVTLNDWSARDIQSFEYQPLGPFLGKSFATSVSAWVLPISAIATARRPSVVQDPMPSDHLSGAGDWAIDIELDVSLDRGSSGPIHVATTNAADLYWTVPQQIAHMTSNGAPIRAGDLIGTGTISGDSASSMGSLLERTANGSSPVEIDGVAVGYLEDGDIVTITARARRTGGAPAPLGAVSGKIN